MNIPVKAQSFNSTSSQSNFIRFTVFQYATLSNFAARSSVMASNRVTVMKPHSVCQVVVWIEYKHESFTHTETYIIPKYEFCWHFCVLLLANVRRATPRNVYNVNKQCARNCGYKVHVFIWWCRQCLCATIQEIQLLKWYIEAVSSTWRIFVNGFSKWW